MLKSIPAGGSAALARALGLTGTGMLVWAGLTTALLQGRGNAFTNLRPFQDRTLGGGLVLTLLLLLLVIARPTEGTRNGWRARAIATLAFSLAACVALIALLHAPTHSPGLIAIAGAVTSLAAFATAWCAPQALERAPSQWWLPAQSALVLLAGAVLFFALMAWLWPGQMAAGATPSLILLGAIAAALVMTNWLAQGRDALVPIARQRFRWGLLCLLLGVPLLMSAVIAWSPGHQRPIWALAVLAMIAVLWMDGHERGPTQARPRNAG